MAVRKEALNMIALFTLYFVQAMPYGFQSRYLPLVMRKRGVSITSLGLYKLLLVPWICKFFLAALLVDVYRTKRFWLLTSMLTLSALSFVGIFLRDTTQLAAVVFALNWASAAQDICVDWFAMRVLHRDDLAIGNTIQVGAFKLGTLFSGGFLVYIMDYTTIGSSFLILTIVYAFSFLTLHCTFASMASSGQSIGSDNTEKDSDVAESTSANAQLSFKRRFFALLTSPGTHWICAFVLIYKLGEQSSLNMMPIYMQDRQVPSTTIGLWTGIYGQTMSIVGSLLAGILLKKYKLNTFTWLSWTLYLRIIPSVIISYFIFKNSDLFWLDTFSLDCLLCLVLAQLFLSGFLTTLTFTLMMEISFIAPASVQASHFSLLATCEVLGKLLFQPVISLYTDQYGFTNAFVVFSLLYVGCILSLPFYPAKLQLLLASPKRGERREEASVTTEHDSKSASKES